MNPALIVTAAMLSCLLCGCNPKALDHSLNVLSGTPDAEPQAFLAIEPSSVEVAAVAVEPVTPDPPHVPVCWWQRWQWYYCDGVYVEPQPPNPYL